MVATSEARHVPRCRDGIDNARVVASWDARRAAPIVDTGRPREAVAGDLLALAIGVIGETK